MTNREFFSEFLVNQTSAGGLWEAVAPLPGDRSSRGLSANSQRKFLQKSPAVPQRVYFCKFRKQKYIFVKNQVEIYKNKKIAIK